MCKRGLFERLSAAAIPERKQPQCAEQEHRGRGPAKRGRAQTRLGRARLPGRRGLDQAAGRKAHLHPQRVVGVEVGGGEGGAVGVGRHCACTAADGRGCGDQLRCRGIAHLDRSLGDPVIMVIGQRVPQQPVGVGFLAHDAVHPVGEDEGVRRVRSGSEVPTHLDRITTFKLDLAGAGPAGEGLAVHGDADVADAVGVVGRQFPEDIGERAADKAEHDNLSHLERALRADQYGINVEAVGAVAFAPVAAGQQAGAHQDEHYEQRCASHVMPPHCAPRFLLQPARCYGCPCDCTATPRNAQNGRNGHPAV